MANNLQILEGNDSLITIFILFMIISVFIITMIAKILHNEVRKDLRRANNHHNHREYLRALNPISKIGYLSRYHKKKLIFSILIAGISWTYNWHLSAY
jgi:hypothetical protein